MIYLVASLIVFAGLFSAFCAAKDYDWFMEHRKARYLSAIIGRGGTRAFYIALGVVLIIVGALFFIHPPTNL